MCSEGENMTKKCIAASIHEIAKIIGYENATNELVPIYQGMFLDNSPSKNIALENLTNFLRCIKEESRTVFLQYIKKAAKNTGNWRARFMIAKQLESLVDLYPTSVILGDLWQVILDLCGDRVAKIRDVAASALGKAGLLILTTGNNTNVILAIKQLVTDQTYTVRLIFAQAAIYLIQIPDFESLFGDELSQIAIDSVVNIRISCALAIKKGLKKNPGNEYWVSLFNKLTHDFDADVRSNITGKYEDNRGVSVLRPAPKQPPSLTPPILRQITADSDIGEIISFNLAGTNLVFEVLKDPIRPDWNGVVADLRIYSATIQELLIEC